MELNQQQKQILLHALGFEGKKRTSSRNLYISLSTPEETQEIEDLLQRGLIESHKQFGGNNLLGNSMSVFAKAYSVTDSGIQAITEIVQTEKPLKRSRKNVKSTR